MFFLLAKNKLINRDLIQIIMNIVDRCKIKLIKERKMKNKIWVSQIKWMKVV
jgi:hypothetical protein